MPAVLYFGRIAVAVTMVNGAQISSSWTWAEQAAIEGLPRQQYIGPKGRGLNLVMMLHPLLGVVPQVAIDTLERIGDRGKSFPVQTGSGRLLGWFVLESINVDLKRTTPDGEIYQAQVSANLKPDRPPEEQEDDPPIAVEGSEQGEETEPELVSVEGDPSEVPLSEVVRA